MRGVFGADGLPGSERRLRLVIGRVRDAMMQEGLVVCRNDGRIAYVNDNVCEMLARKREEMLDRSGASFLGDMHARALLTTVHRDAKSASEWHHAELRTKDGRSIVVHAAIYRVEDRGGHYAGCFIVLTDVTARVRAEAAVRRSESDLRLLSAQLLSAQELERQRIARELHDSIGQAMGGLKYELENYAARVAASGSSEADTLHQLVGKMQSVVDEVRRIAMNLRPSTLDDLGILPTLGWFCREFRAVYGEYNVVTVVDVSEEEIADPVKTAIYRIVQEAFNNVVTHARARHISLEMKSKDGQVELCIRDDGVGFDPSKFASTDEKARGLGMASMRERAEGTGGKFRLESLSGHGTTLTVTWPCRGAVERYAAAPQW
jgi:PAS domain S-box-containing protein